MLKELLYKTRTSSFYICKLLGGNMNPRAGKVRQASNMVRIAVRQHDVRDMRGSEPQGLQSSYRSVRFIELETGGFD